MRDVNQDTRKNDNDEIKAYRNRRQYGEASHIIESAYSKVDFPRVVAAYIQVLDFKPFQVESICDSSR